MKGWPASPFEADGCDHGEHLFGYLLPYRQTGEQAHDLLDVEARLEAGSLELHAQHPYLSPLYNYGDV